MSDRGKMILISTIAVVLIAIGIMLTVFGSIEFAISLYVKQISKI